MQRLAYKKDKKIALSNQACMYKLEELGCYLPKIKSTSEWFKRLYQKSIAAIYLSDVQKLPFNPNSKIGISKEDVYLSMLEICTDEEELYRELGFEYKNLPNLEWLISWAGLKKPECDVVGHYKRYAPMNGGDAMDFDKSDDSIMSLEDEIQAKKNKPMMSVNDSPDVKRTLATRKAYYEAAIKAIAFCANIREKINNSDISGHLAGLNVLCRIRLKSTNGAIAIE